MRYDQIGDAETSAIVQVEFDPVTEQGVDDAAAIPDCDQSGALARGTDMPSSETSPFVESDAGIVQANQRIGRRRALPTNWNCLKLLICAGVHRA